MKRVRLTEGQFHRLIEQALNELSYQTYMNAANKKKINESYKDNKALFDSGAGLMLAQKTAEACNMSVDDAKYEVDCIIDNLSCDARKGNLSYRYIADELAGLGLDMEEENIEAVNQLVQAYQKPEWDNEDDDYDEFGELDYDRGEEGDYNPNESLSRSVTESVIRRLNEWEEDDDWEDDDEEEDENDEEEDEYNNEPTVESLTDAAGKLSAEKVFNEFAQEISRDDEEALINDIVSEGGTRVKYLLDYVEEIGYKPIDLLRQADRYFGTWKTGQWAQEILHQLRWNPF